MTDEQIEAGARWLAENVMHHKWEGLSKEGRSGDWGFPAWKVGGQHNARQEDYRDAVRGMLKAMETPAVKAQ